MIEIRNVNPDESAGDKIKVSYGVEINIVLAGVNLYQPKNGESIITIADNNPEDALWDREPHLTDILLMQMVPGQLMELCS